MLSVVRKVINLSYFGISPSVLVMHIFEKYTFTKICLEDSYKANTGTLNCIV